MGLFDLFGNKKKKIADFQRRGALVLDVRTQKEYDSGAIAGSKHIPIKEVENRIDEIKQWDKPIITCCVSGVRSGTAVTILKSHGIEAVNGGGWISLRKKLQL